MRRNWKKSITLILIVGLFMVLAQGCAPAPAPAPAPKTVEFPTKPITIIVPWGPQSWGFLQTQELAVALEPLLGVRVLVEAMPGGASAVGTKFVKEAAPDGYTLLNGWVAGLAVQPLFQDPPGPGYDVLQDFELLAHFTETPVIALSRADAPWNTMAEFIAYVKANPGKSFAFSGGPALSVHSLFGGQIFRDAGVNVRGIFYDDAAAAGAAMMAGDVQVAFDSFATLERFGKDKVKAIGVLAERRFPGFDDIPTLAEQGIKTPTVPSWSGILAPKGLPPEVKDILNEALRKVLTSEGFQQRIFTNMRWYVTYKDGDGLKARIEASKEQLREPIARQKAAQAKR